MSTTKKILINIGCGILILCAGFGAGRFCRLTSISGASSGIESGVVSIRSDANSILDDTIDGIAAGESAIATQSGVGEGIEELQQSFEKLSVFTDEVIRAIEMDQQATESFESAYRGASDAALSAIDIAIQHAEQYEELIGSLQQAYSNLAKDESKCD